MGLVVNTIIVIYVMSSQNSTIKPHTFTPAFVKVFCEYFPVLRFVLVKDIVYLYTKKGRFALFYPQGRPKFTLADSLELMILGLWLAQPIVTLPVSGTCTKRY